MVWGCMSAKGVGFLKFIEGTVNAEVYQNILGECLIPSIDTLKSNTGHFLFQQDNAACHTAHRIARWFNENNIPVLQWPANSPDISPIETLWGRMKKELRKNPARNLHDLKQKLQTIWDSFTPDSCQELINSVPQRIKAVISRKGDATQY